MIIVKDFDYAAARKLLGTKKDNSNIEHHIICEGWRRHVISWHGSKKVCSEPNCEINKT